ncbi:flagellar export protein FliJ [Ideonella paludis]|uniref:Flagellar FliJ protein n=1 Tax=Ideonella paludis TaxID=1233411 RepID=A0ABS5DXV2_9BURK|nr:flagellar export protein FliJ [Ideonella paludis]MBQ0935894.1 flagellar export protein FliJ [Ideonella paludis]
MDRVALLRLLEDRDRKRRDEALMQWQEAVRQAEAAGAQAQALETYRSEYRERWSTQFKQAAPIEIIRCYQGFVERLDQAIGSQQATVEQHAARVAAARERLQQREIKLATVQRLIDRRLSAAQQVLQRREQKASDEAAQRVRRAGLTLAPM